jgi:hypothetical protein
VLFRSGSLPPMRILAALLLLVTFSPRAGFSEPLPDPADVAARARAFFLRGVELYDERDFAGAGVEFRRAYEILPNFRILFNLGQVSVELHDYASAIDSFTRYLAEGGDRVPPDRRRKVDEELARLRPRVGHINLTVDEAGAEVYLDDAPVGRAPLAAALPANVGTHRIEVHFKNGSRQVRVVDVPGEETVAVHLAQPVSKSAPVAPLDPRPAPALSVERSASAPERPSQSRVWIGWTATALCAGGAAVLGLLAYRSSQDLRDLRQSYPIDRDALDSKQGSVRTLAAVADGLAAAAVVLGGLSLYFTLDRGSKKAGMTSGVSVGLLGPEVVGLTGRF